MPEPLFNLWETPQFIALHAIICALGIPAAFTLMNHAWHNPKLSRLKRALWLTGIAGGYGMTFYWWLHFVRGDQNIRGSSSAKG